MAKPSAKKQTPRIGKNGPPLAHPLPKQHAHQRVVEYLAEDADHAEWFSVMQRADRGDTGPMMDLFSDARDRDSHLDGVVRKRVQSMMGRPIVFRPPVGFERDRDALETAQFVSRVLLEESPQFRSQLCGLMAGAPYGYGVSKLLWRTNWRSERVPVLEWAHPNRFAFDDCRRLGFYDGPYRSNTRIRALSEFPDQFVAHVPMGGRSDYPWRRGPMRSCIVPSFLKRKGLAFILPLLERFGMPMPYAKVPPGTDHDGQSNTDTIGVVQQALQDLTTHWSAVFSQGIEIDQIPGSGEAKGDAHKILIDWAEMTMSIAILGQNLSTKVEGGSFAAAEAHRYVAGDLHLADAVELAETITQQIVEPIIRYNRPGAPLPICEITTGAKQVFTIDDVREGVCSADERRRTLGHDAIPDGKGAEYRTTVQVPADIEAAPVLEEEPAAGEAIDTESVAPTEAVAKDPSTGLNGAQLAEAKQLLIDVQLGVLPKETAKALILASLPFSADQVEKMLAPIVPAASSVPAAAAAPEAA